VAGKYGGMVLLRRKRTKGTDDSKMGLKETYLKWPGQGYFDSG